MDHDTKEQVHVEATTEGMEVAKLDQTNLPAKKKEKGASMVEYALVIGLIAVLCIIAVRVLGQQVSKQFSNVAGQL